MTGYKMINVGTFLIETMRLGWTVGQLGAESCDVMTLRIGGMAGLWDLPQGEIERMVEEKQPAFADAWVFGTLALVRGESSAAALDAALTPLHDRARDNRLRLSAA